MRLKLFSLFAALLLVAACETAPEETGDTGGTGGGVDVTSPKPPTSDDEPMVKDPAGETMVKPAAEQLSEIGDRVHFDFDKFNLKPVARARIRDWANFMNDNPALLVTLQGNCDERGTREYNLALGARRANSVRDFLVGLGIDADRLHTISYGKERPIALGSNETAWAQNRNVHIAVN